MASVKVIPTEQAIDRIPPGARVPDQYHIDKCKTILRAQGMIEPLHPQLKGPWDLDRLYAAVELGWSTVIIVEVDAKHTDDAGEDEID